MVKSKEWSTGGHEKLDIPPEVWRGVKFRVIYRLGESAMVAWCRRYKVRGAEIRLQGVLTDTSERIQGILMTKRITYREEVRLVNVPTTIFPLDPEEVPANARE